MNKPEISTHRMIDQSLCGMPVEVMTDTSSVVELTATPEMRADTTGLVHGGFIFGLADYAAMLAVNHPNVVLSGARVSFLRPASVGECMKAYARVANVSGRKRSVSVEIEKDGELIFEGEFTCIVPEKHVLEKAGA
jgi:uncharacterized protein (TIGR00369 family)